MAKELALIAARNNRNKKKKEQLELQAPARKTVANNTVQNKKTTQTSNAKKNTTVDTKSTVQKTSNNLLSFNNRNKSNSMLSTPKRDNTTVKTSDVNKDKNKKSSITTVDIYTKNGRFYYDDNGKQHEVDRDSMMKAWNNNRSGVVGQIDKKGKFQETDSRGVNEQDLANKNYKEKLNIYNKAQETLNQKRSKEYAKRGVDLSTQSNLQLNPQNQMLNFANKNEQTQTPQQKLNERAERQQPLIEEANKQLQQEIQDVNKAANDYAFAKYQKNVADVNNKDIGVYDKTLGAFLTGVQDIGSNFVGDNKYIDENGNTVYLPNRAELLWQKTRDSYGDNIVGKLAKFGGDVAHEGGKIAATALLNAPTGGIGGSALYFSDIAGDIYKQNINEGYSEDKAWTDALLKTGQNYIKQRLIGGLGGKLTGTGPSWLEKSLTNTWSKAVSNPVVSKTLASMSSEAIDEFTDEWIESAIDSAVLGKDFDPMQVFKESLYSGAIGGATGAFGGLGERVTSSINDNALAQQQLYELNTIADQRIQQLQQEVQQDPTRAQSATQEIEDIQNYVKAQTNTILKQAQTGEIREANTNTQLPQFNSQMAQNTPNTEQQTTTQQNKLPVDTNDKVTNFRNSVANENVNDADGFYKSVEKIIKDKDYNVILDSSITNEQGKPVNAVISNENGITIRINPKSERAGEILLTHEITHGIETKEMSNLIMDYASKNSEFNDALQDLKKAYGTENITPEVVADISGQLLGTQEFIKTLSTEKPSLFKRIHDKIIELANKITGNSKEKRFIDDLKVKWEKAYRESNLQTAQQNIKEGAKYSQNTEITDITDSNGDKLSKGQVDFFDESKVRDDEGKLIKVYHTNKYIDLPFFEFKPQKAADYHSDLFDDETVIFATDSEVMSGSYAKWNYEKADTKRINSIKEFKNKMNNEILNNDETGTFFTDIDYNVRKGSDGKIHLFVKDVFEDNPDYIKPLNKVYNNEEEFLRNGYLDVLKSFGNKSKLQYEGYMNITNPYIIDSDGRFYNEAKYELYDDIKKTIDEIGEDKEKLHELALESEKKYEEFLKTDKTNYEVANRMFRFVDDEDLLEARNNGLFSTGDDYETIYNSAKEQGIELPYPDTRMEDIVDYWGIKDLRETWDDYYIDNFLNESVSGFVKKYSELTQKYRDYGMEKSNWFVKNYQDVSPYIGDYFRGASWFNIAKNMFDETSIGRAGGAKSLTTNDVVHYILAENKTKLQKEKYDGVIFKNIVDYADFGQGVEPANVYVAFNSNQFKAADNLDPTSDPDIRYSKKVDKWQKFLDKYYPSRGTTTVLKDKISKTTSESVVKDFNEAKKGNLNNKKMRRYVKTSNEATGMEETIKKADINKLTYEVKSNKKTYQEAQNNIKDLTYEERLSRSKNLLNSSKKVTATDMAEAQIALLEAAKAGKIDDYLDLQQDIAIMGTELGQTVQAMSMIRKMSPDGQLQTLTKIVNRKQKTGNKNYENVKLKPELVKNVLDSYDNDTHTTFNQEKLDNAMDKLKQDVADQMKVTASEKLNEWRYLSMLGNPKTHVRNIVGNVVMSIVKGIKDIQSAGLQDLLIRNPESKTATLKRASNDVKALSDIAFSEMMDIDNKGNKYVDTDTIEQKRKIFKNKTLEALRKFNLKALNVEDNVFKKAHFKKSFTSYLTAKGIKTAEDINNNPQVVADAKLYAMQQAKIATFQEENSIASWIKDLDQKGPVARVVRGAVIPFTGVPMNIAKRGIEYTPGIGMGKVISDFKKAPKNQRGNVLIDGLSKQMTGTSLAILGYVLAKSGIVTADAGDDKEDKYLKDLGAKMNYSIKIGDTSYDLSWLSPSSMPFFVGASGYEQWEKKEGIDGNFIFDALASTLDPLSEMSVISSFTDVLSSYNQSEMGKIKDMGESMIQSYSSQFIPTLFSQFARTLDDTKRNTYADKNSQWTFGEETIKKLQYKIPGLRNMLPEQTDYLGNTKKENDNVIKRGIEAFLSPASTKKDTSDRVTKELVKLYDETGDTGVIPGKQDLYIKYKKEKYDLTQREYNQLKRDYGALVNAEVNRAIKSNDYQNLSASEQAEVISNIISYAGFKARDNYMESNGIDYTNSKYNTAKKAEDSGYAIADFYVTKRMLKEDKQKTTTSDVNRYLELKEKGIDGKTFDEFKAFVKTAKATKTANGGYVRGSKKQKIINYINSLPLSASAKKALWDDYNNPNNQGYIQYYK